MIQLVTTWNDYGEGTNIESTEETGYQYLEIIQQLDTQEFVFTPEDLRLPLQLFNARIAGELTEAVNMLEGLHQ